MPDENAAFQRGKDFFEQKDYEAAAREFEAAIQAEPRRAECQAWYARTLICLGRSAEAIKVAERAEALQSSCAMAHYALANACNDNDQNDLVIAHYYSALHHDPLFVAAYNNLGIALIAKRTYQRAIDNLSRAIDLAPRDATAYINRGLAYDLAGRPTQAKRDFDMACEIAPTNPTAFYSSGVFYHKLGNLARAAADFSRVIHLDAAHKPAHIALGDVSVESGDFGHAISDYWKVIELDPVFAPAYHRLGLALTAKGEYADAIHHFTRALTLRPDEAYFFEGRAWAKRAIGDVEGHLLDMGRACRLHGPSPYFDQARQPTWDQLHKHVAETLCPELNSTNEFVLNYYPGTIRWGKPGRLAVLTGAAKAQRFAHIGFGYLCLSTHGVHVFAFSDLSRTWFNRRKERGIQTTDESWSFPYRHLKRSRPEGAQILVETSDDSFSFQPHYASQLEILPGIQFGLNDRLLRQWDAPAAPKMSPDDFIAKMDQLVALKQSGALSDQEFEDQRKRLMAET